MKYLPRVLLGALFFCSVFSFAAAQVSAPDATGRSVTVPQKPSRIISLAPAATEILFAIGAQNQITARTDYCDYPPAAKKLPSLGGFDGKTFSLEKLLSFRPDFVYAYSGMHNHLVEPLERYGIPVYLSDSRSIADTLKEIKTVALLTGHKQEGQRLADAIAQEIEKTRAQNEGQNPKRVYWEIWNSPYMSVGSGSYLNDLLEVSGGINIFAAVTQPYPVVSEESVIARNPQIILLADDSAASFESIRARPGWQLTEAVKNGAIFKVDANLFSRPGPRIAEAVSQLTRILRGEKTGIEGKP